MYLIGSELSVPQYFYEHVGVYVGNGRVFHNHPVRGEELVSLNDFATGRKITVRRPGVSDVSGFFHRVREARAKPTPYRFLTNNCEHTVSKLRTGVARSPQVQFWGCMLGVVGMIITLRSR